MTHARPTQSMRRYSLVFLLLAATLGLGVSLWAPPTNIGRLDSLTAAQRALAAAQDDINRVFGPGVNILEADPDAAARLLADAYQQLKTAGSAGAGAVSMGAALPLSNPELPRSCMPPLLPPIGAANAALPVYKRLA